MELTKVEQQVLGDRQFFMVKAVLNGKLDQAFSSMKMTWMDEVGKWPLPEFRVDVTRGKIFRGENYNGFPYTLMDYPRAFSKSGVFAVRTMCWWGNEFSFTLHLQGEGLALYVDLLEERLNRLVQSECYCCIASNPWNYEFVESNYAPIQSLDINEFSNQVRQRDFIKIALRIGLDEINSLEEKGSKAIALFGRFLKS